jgi:hypothetical protein
MRDAAQHVKKKLARRCARIYTACVKLRKHGRRTLDLDALDKSGADMTEGDLAAWMGISENLARRYRTAEAYGQEGERDWPEHYRVPCDGRPAITSVRYRQKDVMRWAKRLPKD